MAEENAVFICNSRFLKILVERLGHLGRCNADDTFLGGAVEFWKLAAIADRGSTVSGGGADWVPQRLRTGRVWHSFSLQNYLAKGTGSGESQVWSDLHGITQLLHW